jgi:guanylate kinase
VGGEREAAGAASGLVFVLSGPSGVGKDSVARRLREQGFPLGYCITATTRRQRPTEVHGVNYFFVTLAEFERMRAEGELLEYARVHENYYGIPIAQVRDGLRRGQDLLITVDVQGARTVRSRLDNAILVFLAPESLDELIPRLQSRGTETEDERAIRLANAALEMEQRWDYDYCVVNERDRLDDTADRVRSIIVAERSRVHQRLVTL